jgi:hypothetical protein
MSSLLSWCPDEFFLQSSLFVVVYPAGIQRFAGRERPSIG